MKKSLMLIFLLIFLVGCTSQVEISDSEENQQDQNPEEEFIPQPIELQEESTQAESCSDSNVYCVPQEYSTIQAAANAADTPGDIVLVDDGIYQGFQVPYDHDGTPNNKITFKSKNKWGAIINQPYPGSSTDYRNTGIAMGSSAGTAGECNNPSADNIVIKDFEVQNVGIGIGMGPSSGIDIIGNKIHDVGIEGVKTWFADNILIENNIIYNQVGPNHPTHGHAVYFAGSKKNGCCDNFVLRNNIIYNAVSVQVNAHYSYLYGCAPLDPNGYEASYNVTFEGNVLGEIKGKGFSVLNCEECFIKNNIIYDWDTRAVDLAGDATPSDLEYQFNSRKSIISNNVFVAHDHDKAIDIRDTTGGNGGGDNKIFNNIIATTNPSSGINDAWGVNYIESNIVLDFYDDSSILEQIFENWAGSDYANTDWRIKENSLAHNTGILSITTP